MTVLPYCTYSHEAQEFVEAAYDLGWVTNLDWPEWMQTPEAVELLQNPAHIAGATADQLANLLTALIRRDRFCEGDLASTFNAGILTAIVRRAEALLQTLAP